MNEEFLSAAKTALQVSELHSDRPIESEKDDRLGRVDFSQRLALSLSRWRQRESLVVALYGPWGSGKTSVKNMVCQYLSSEKDNAVRVVEINPWEVSGSGAMEVLFYSQILAAFSDPNASPEEKETVPILRKFFATLQQMNHFVKPATYAATIIGGPIAGAVTATLGESISLSADMAEKLGLQKEQAEEITFPQLKEKLKEKLRSLEKPLIVIIDDIDRLTGEEICLLLRLVKANADLPSLTYFLLFQRETVERAIHLRTGENGAAYLEKVVQIGLELPMIPRQKIAKEFSSGIESILTRLLGDFGLEALYEEKERLSDLWRTCLSSFIRTFRDVARFLNVFEFKLQGVIRNGMLEVNPVDFIAIQALYLFQPEVATRLAGEKESLTGSFKREDNKEPLPDIFELAGEHKKAVDNILQGLFPRVFGMDSSSQNHPLNLLIERQRVCTAQHFDRYFSGEIGESDISQLEIQAVIEARHDREIVLTLLKEARAKGREILLIECLGSNTAINQPDSIGWAAGLCDFGDEMPALVAERFHTPTVVFIASILREILAPIQSMDERKECVRRWIMESKGIAVPARIVEKMEQHMEESRAPNHWPLFTSAEINQLRGEMVRRLRAASQEPNFIHLPVLLDALYPWARWDEKGVKQWTAAKLVNPDDALSLLKTLMIVKPFGGETSVRKTSRISWQIVQRFASLEEWKKAVEPLSQKNGVKKILLMLDQAAARRAQGIADDWQAYLPEDGQD